MSTRFVGPGRIYVRFAGASSRVARDSVLREMPVAANRGFPSSLAELRATRLSSREARDATSVANSADAYDVEFDKAAERRFFGANH